MFAKGVDTIDSLRKNHNRWAEKLGDKCEEPPWRGAGHKKIVGCMQGADGKKTKRGRTDHANFNRKKKSGKQDRVGCVLTVTRGRGH